MTKKITFTTSLLYVLHIFCFSIATVQADQADSLYADAKALQSQRKHPDAKAAYQQIIRQYPNSPSARGAELKLLGYEVRSLVVDGKDAEVESKIAGAKKTFADHVGLPWFLYTVAEQYDDLKKYEKAGVLYGQVLQQYPDSLASRKATLRLLGHKVQSLVAAGDDAAVQAEIAGAKKTFADHADLSRFLYNIAKQYNKLKKYDQARDLYGQVVGQYPNSSFARGARLYLLKYDVRSLVAAGNDAAAQSKITQVKNEFAGHPDLPSFYQGIAGQYEELKKRPEAKAVYQRIVNDFSRTALYPGSEMKFTDYAKYQIAKLDICDLVRRGDDAKVQQEVDNLLPQFMYNLNGPAAVSILVIGEEYCLMAEEAAKAGDSNQVKINYQKALAIWNEFEQAIPDHNRPEYPYLSGIVCQKLGQYEQALSHFQRVTEKWPDYENAWDAHMTIARCCQVLNQKGAITDSETERIIRACYVKVVEKHPNCPGFKVAQRWLESRSKKN